MDKKGQVTDLVSDARWLSRDDPGCAVEMASSL
jgi:hypothetical protein